MILEPPGCSERKDVTCACVRGRGVYEGQGSYIVDFAVQDDPAAVGGVVLCDCAWVSAVLWYEWLKT